MTTGIRSNADGSKSYIQVGGTDVVTVVFKIEANGTVTIPGGVNP